MNPLFKFIGTVTVLSNPEPFIAKKKFVNDWRPAAKVKITIYRETFNNYFLSGDGKIEAPIDERALNYADMQSAASTKSIVDGFEGSIEVTLREVYFLMEIQGNGESGVLLTNGCQNIFCVLNQEGVLHLVSISWIVDSWYVIAYEVDNFGTLSGGRIFYRNSEA